MFYFLLENEKYDLEYAINSLSKVEILKLESSIILIKLNRLEEAAKKILYCEQPNLMFYIKQIIKKFPLFDLVYLILKDIKNTYPNKIKNLYDSNKNFDNSIKQIKSQISENQNLEKPILSLESIFMDILIEIYDEYELILVQFFV